MYYGNNYPSMPMNIQQPVQTPGNSLFHINNKQEAENWMVEPGKVAYLFDDVNQKFYIKSVAINGMVNPLEEYNFEKCNVENANKTEYVTREEFEQLKELLNEFTTTDTDAKK